MKKSISNLLSKVFCGILLSIKTTFPAHDTDDCMGRTTIAFYHNRPETVCINGVAEITLSY